MLNQNMTSSFVVPDDIDLTAFFGPADEHLRLIQDSFQARVIARGNVISLEGNENELTSLVTLFTDMVGSMRLGERLGSPELKRSISLLKTGELAPTPLKKDVILSHRGHVIRPKTATQKHYVDCIRENTITFGIGPAGTGKTYLAMAMAVDALERKEVGRIVLTRPVVEAGENLGFLPGTLTEKIDPYIRPLYDALFEMMDGVRATKLLDEGVIEIAPLAFMRGRTLNDAFVILDEAQNTTPEQMKMFLTRLGMGSKMVITGDVTQTDLPRGISGLKTVRQVLDGIGDIAFCEFHSSDVVRNSLVAKIVSAYARAQEKNLKL